MRFCWSTLNVKNLDESITFYQEILGLEMSRRVSGGPNTEIAFLGEAGQTEIELICDGDNQSVNVGPDISWGFEVDSLDKALEKVKEKGIKVESGPIQPNPHVKFFFIKDPNGMRIQLVEQIA
ncbi:VOC family protein [Aminipila luticellarii]|uniref:VOC family protein n=1 Tax=Aminipila luticellarii TaxID=2507160 RepID=A0A410PTW6_9FIRM|nr:VOC family protein [Aminipila luticellarii]QAT42354.1 VOC family protein [Aminipila luticellarii]